MIPLPEVIAELMGYQRGRNGEFLPNEILLAETAIRKHRLIRLPESPNGEAGDVEVESRIVGHDQGGYPNWEHEPVYQHFVGQVSPIPNAGCPVFIIPITETPE